MPAVAIVISLVFFLFSSLALGKDVTISKGSSKEFATSANITTVFTSDPKIVDYRIVSPKQVVIYANDIGQASVKVFGNEGKKQNKVLLSLEIRVDSDKAGLNNLEKLIESRVMGSSIKIEKLSLPETPGYVISGSVLDEGSRDAAYNMAAIGLGLEPEKIEKKAIGASRTSSRSSSDDEDQDSTLDFLTRYESPYLIDKMQIQLTRQVNVKLIVADVEKNLADKLGFDFNGGNFIVPLFQGDGVTRWFNFAKSNFLLTIEALRNEQTAKILAQPNLSVISGESAKFSVTGQYTPITNTVTFGGQPISSPGTPRDYGISLTIQPKVISSDRVVVSISQEVSNIQSIIEKNGASAANLKKRRAESTIEVADGQSFVIGGLLDERDNENISSVPFLGDIPYLGALFRKTNITRSKNELIIVATVTLVKPLSESIGLLNYQNRSLADSWFNVQRKTFKGDQGEMNAFVQNIGFIQ